MANLRVGMVGAGSWAKQHLDAWKQSDDATVTAIWNRTESKAEKLADEYGIPTVYTDLDGLIARDDVDVISISMPHNLHYSISLKAIEGGKHVFCEKPLTMTYEEANELWQCSEERGVKTGIQFSHRCTPGLQKLRQLIDEGYLGAPQYAELKTGLEAARDPGLPLIWRFQKSLAGYGVLGDLGVYMIDMARWMFGEFASVAGDMSTFITERPTVSDRYDLHELLQMYNEGTLPESTETGEVDNEDECNFMAVFKSGAKGYFRVSRFHEATGQSFHGSGGVLSWDRATSKLTGKRDVGSEMEEISVPDPERPETIVSQFVDNILNGTALPPSFYDGLRAQEVMHAVDQSSRERRWISLPLDDV